METEKSHAKLSASGSERWLNCAGSVTLSEKAPPERESPYAKEGTDAHLCLEMFFKNVKHPSKVVPMLKNTYPKEMIEHALRAFNYIKSNLEKGSMLISEVKVLLDFVREDMYGTVDAAIINEFGRLHVFDYKYGAGVPVEPKDNTQMIYYALGLAYKYHFNFEDVALTIIQPRAEHHEGTIRTWVMSIDELRAWEGTFREGVERTETNADLYEPGDWCRWCPAKSICPSLSTLALKEAQIDFDDTGESSLALPPVAEPLSPKGLSIRLQAIDKIETWIEAVKTEAFHQAKAGVKIPGFKLVQKRSTRKWVDESKVTKEAIKLFGKKALSVPELLSPAQLEKAVKVKPEWIEKRTNKESSGETLVAASDSRPEYNAIEKDFGDPFDCIGNVSEVLSEADWKKNKKNHKPKTVNKTKRRK